MASHHHLEREQFTSISSGSRHTCALTQDKTAICWGDDEHGQSSPPEGEQFIAISSGGVLFAGQLFDGHTCALRHDGSAVCWGDNISGQSSPPEGERFTSISTGEGHTCALREDGTAVCWGYNKLGSTVPPKNERFTDISVGEDYTCALRGDGSPVCWGHSRDGAANPPQEERFTALSSSEGYACGLRSDGSVACWGLVPPIDASPLWNDFGQAAPPESERFTAISSGPLHTCALREDGTPFCWGVDTVPKGGEHFIPVAGNWTSSETDGMPVGDERFTTISSGSRQNLRAPRGWLRSLLGTMGRVQQIPALRGRTIYRRQRWGVRLRASRERLNSLLAFRFLATLLTPGGPPL